MPSKEEQIAKQVSEHIFNSGIAEGRRRLIEEIIQKCKPNCDWEYEQGWQIARELQKKVKDAK